MNMMQSPLSVENGLAGRKAAAPGDGVESLHRGELTVLYEPLEFYCRGRRVRLSPLEGAILELIARRGRASSEDLDALFAAEGASVGTLDVHVCRIRRKFMKEALLDPIETVRAWGLKLNLESLGASDPRLERPAIPLRG